MSWELSEESIYFKIEGADSLVVLNAAAKSNKMWLDDTHQIIGAGMTSTKVAVKERELDCT